MKHILLAVGLASLLAAPAPADGIPEPGIIFYGAVENTAHNNGRLTVGSLSWTVTTAGAAPVTVTTGLTNLAGANSYRLRIPYESVVGGSTASPSAFVLNAGATAYSHAGIRFSAGGSEYPASIVGPSLAVYNLSAATRGVVQQLNLRVNAPGVIPGAGSRFSSANSVGDGSGGGSTPPPFQFTSIDPHPDGGVVVQWRGAPKERPYLLLRAQAVDSGLGEYEVVKSFPASPATANSFWDTNTVNTTAYFYQLLLQ